MLSRYQNAAVASREYVERFSERHHPGPRQYSGEIDRIGLKILENNKNIQSIISVNTNILLRRFRLKFLRIMYSTSCNKERLNFENTLYNCKVKKINIKYSPAFVRRGVTKIRRVCFIRVYAFACVAKFNTVFFFFRANQTSFKDEFLLTAFFIDDQFFDINLK
jgi:hypothetical protein